MDEIIVDNCENEDINDIRKNLLCDFESAKTACKDMNEKSCVTLEREPVRVYLRVRPFSSEELIAEEKQGCLEQVDESCVHMHPPKTSFSYKNQARQINQGETVHKFTFSHVFGPDTDQKEFFETTFLSTVEEFIHGQNGLVFCYGVTNAGKTYTILGSGQSVGILPRTLNLLFNSIKDQSYDRTNLKPKMFCDVQKLSSIQEESEESKKKMLLSLGDISTYHKSISSTDLSLQNNTTSDISTVLDCTKVDMEKESKIKFALWISFAEIYTEQVFDLLEPISVGKPNKRTVLKLGDDRKGNPYIKGLTQIHVKNTEEALQLLKIGRKNRKIASTKLNENSSRSHCIFTLKIIRVVDTKQPHLARVSTLSFVDLAGSERYTKTHNTGVRLKEAGNINTSLMTLGKCIEMLRYNQTHVNNPKNVPFRESKLTRIFQGFFCGKGKATMIVNVNQCASSFDETLQALKFSAIAKKVTTAVYQPDADVPELPEHKQVNPVDMTVPWADDGSNTPTDNQNTPADDHDTMVVEEESNNELQRLVEKLQEKLIEERKKMVRLELKIREEVSAEMCEQLVEIENSYNDRLVEERQMHEEIYEKRLDLAMKSVKRKKRRMVDDDDDDENDDKLISDDFLKQEQLKVLELRKKIAELEQENKDKTQLIGKHEEQIEILKKDLEKKTCDLGKLQNDLQLQAEEMLALKQALEVQRNHRNDEKVELEKVKTELEGYKEQTPLMKEKLENKEKQCIEMMKLKKDLIKRLQDTTEALDKKNTQIISKNSHVAKLEKTLESMKEDLSKQVIELNQLRVTEKTQATKSSQTDVVAEPCKTSNQFEALTVEFEALQEILAGKCKENDELTGNLKFVEGELEILTNNEKNEHKEMIREMEKCKKEKDKLEKEKEEMQDDYERKIESLENEVASLKSSSENEEEKSSSVEKESNVGASSEQETCVGDAASLKSSSEHEEVEKSVSSEKESNVGDASSEQETDTGKVASLQPRCMDQRVEKKCSSEKELSVVNDDEDAYNAPNVKSFDQSTKERIEMDVTPITGTDLPPKKKLLKRKCSKLTLKEIKGSYKKKIKGEQSEDEFTPLSAKKMRIFSSHETLYRSESSSSVKSLAMSSQDDNSDENRPLSDHNSPRKTPSKLGIFSKLKMKDSTKTKQENTTTATIASKKRRKLLKKNDISVPFSDATSSTSDENKSNVAKTHELITKHLRSRTIKHVR